MMFKYFYFHLLLVAILFGGFCKEICDFGLKSAIQMVLFVIV